MPRETAGSEFRALNCTQCGAPLNDSDACSHCGTRFEITPQLSQLLKDESRSLLERMNSVTPAIVLGDKKGYFRGEDQQTYQDFLFYGTAAALNPSKPLLREPMLREQFYCAIKLVDSIARKGVPVKKIDQGKESGGCPRCGGSIKPNHLFCGHCGLDLS